MSIVNVPIDGLWRCLCPAIDSIALHLAARQTLRPNPRLVRVKPRFAGANGLQTRGYTAKANDIGSQEDEATQYSDNVSRAGGKEVKLKDVDGTDTQIYPLEGRDIPLWIEQENQAQSRQKTKPNSGLTEENVSSKQDLVATGALSSSRDETRLDRDRLTLRPLFPAEQIGRPGSIIRKIKSSFKEAGAPGSNNVEDLEVGSAAFGDGNEPSTTNGKSTTGKEEGHRTESNKLEDILDRSYSELGKKDGKVQEALNRLFGGGDRRNPNPFKNESGPVVSPRSRRAFPRRVSSGEIEDRQSIAMRNDLFASTKCRSKHVPTISSDTQQTSNVPISDASLVQQQEHLGFDDKNELLHNGLFANMMTKHRPRRISTISPILQQTSSAPLFDSSLVQKREPHGSSLSQIKTLKNVKISRHLSEIENWERFKTTELHDQLRASWNIEGKYDRVVQLVEYLLKSRHENPQSLHFEALIRANANAEQGSAECVRGLLQEMRELGIRGDSGLYHGALQVLAIHPDYDLRTEILQDMKERWFGLSPEGWHSLVAGLLRDRQIEMALDKLEQMHTDEIVIQPWLYDIFTYTLCELEEIDEAFKLFQYRYEHSRFGISTGHWQYLLDKFSSAFHYEATKQIWDTRVQVAGLVPSDGTCTAVLDIAARNADPALATSVVQILSARQTPLSVFHYEALVSAYTGVKDIRTAFRVLGIMERSGLDPSSSNTRPLYTHLSTSDTLCHEAWDILLELRGAGQQLPVTAVNVVLEALCRSNHVDEAYTYYKRLHEICPNGPNTETINTMLQGLQRARESSKYRAMFLASEMQALNIKPDILTYDRLIMICLHEADYEDAFRYLAEMEEVGRDSVENDRKGWWMRRGTASAMVRVCARHADPRAHDILMEMEQRGMPYLRQLRTSIDKEWGSGLPSESESK